jgi:hypothetical protein
VPPAGFVGPPSHCISRERSNETAANAAAARPWGLFFLPQAIAVGCAHLRILSRKAIWFLLCVFHSRS